ncbi:MAG TPA: tRNA pseudouridine(55) synthase TruB [Candidatus Limnocylindrales bacterium]|nr:tRNA pseudouridine(55) synthase TruB [Candidatus Limnocylindrales bacterium]
MISGILNIDKPIGRSSFAAVRLVRQIVGVERVGHGGTLDPAAGGVLPVLLGPATRLSDFVHEWPKTYLATIQLGATSDTFDREGVITPSGDPTGISQAAIETALPRFIGTISQVPPMHSALKQGGEALYRKARRGEVVDRAPRPVQVLSLRLLAWDRTAGQCRIEVRSGKGMYVRSLAHDLGAALGAGGYLAALTRSAFGPLRVEDALPLETLRASPDAWREKLLPMDLPLRGWPAITVEGSRARAIEHGQAIPVPEASTLGRHRLIDEGGRLLAWGTVDATRHLQPQAVFPR